MPLLRERLRLPNPYVRQFLIGWITVLDSVPDIDMLEFLPDLLEGLLNMLDDANAEIRQQADAALAEFLQEIKQWPSIDLGRVTPILVGYVHHGDAFPRLTALAWLHELVDLTQVNFCPFIDEEQRDPSISFQNGSLIM